MRIKEFKSNAINFFRGMQKYGCSIGLSGTILSTRNDVIDAGLKKRPVPNPVTEQIPVSAVAIPTTYGVMQAEAEEALKKKEKPKPADRIPFYRAIDDGPKHGRR